MTNMVAKKGAEKKKDVVTEPFLLSAEGNPIHRSHHLVIV
jgi:hypothetical protein